LKVGSISYLNSIPFVYGLEKSYLNIELITEIPSVCAQLLLQNKVDMALVPVAIIPSLKNPKIISPYCIASNGAVQTVCLFSEEPLDQIDTIILDYHSRTSNELVQVLCRHYWKISPKFELSHTTFENSIKGKTAGLIIGDRAYQYRSTFANIYDLSLEWKNFCGLPFVFACWVATADLDPIVEQDFCDALKHGIDHLDLALKDKSHLYDTTINKREYLTQVIDYHLDDTKRMSMKKFFDLMG